MKKGSIIFVLVLLLASVSIAQEKLSLDDCVAIGLQSNTLLQNAQHQLDMAKSQRMNSWQGLLPRLTASATLPSRTYSSAGTRIQDTPIIDPATNEVIRWEQQEKPFSAQTYKNFSGNVTFSQNIWDNGASLRQVQRGFSTVNSNKSSLNFTAVNTIQLIKQRYFELIRALKQREVFEQNYELAQNQFSNAEVMYSVGTVPQNDVLRTQASVGDSRIGLIDQDIVIENAKQQLNLAMGRDINTPMDVVLENNTQVNYNLSLDNLTSQALSRNPNLMRLEEDIKGSAYDVKIAKAARYPSIGGYAQYSRRNPLLERIYDDMTLNYSFSVGLQFNLTLFDGFQIHNNVQRAVSTMKMNEENFEDGKRTTISNVKMAYLRVMAYRNKIEINETMVEAAEENYRLADERYKIGSGTLLEMIDARSNLVRVRFQLVQLQYDAKIAEAQLEAAVGAMDQKYLDMIENKN
ncbi:TolC family protein [candidate division KSB1 bacterium]